jgi:cobalt/nickel transport system permease protein
MTVPLAFPVNLRAPLGQVDPRWKLAALVPAGAVVGSLRSWGPASAALALALAIAWLAQMPLRWYVCRVGILTLGLSLFLVFLPLAGSVDDKSWQLGPVAVSQDGLIWAGVLLFKAVALVTLLLAAATTAPFQIHLKALHALRVPGLLVQLVALTIRYLAVLLAEFARIRIALRVRGYRQQATLRSLCTVGRVWGTLLVLASDRAERVSQAMRCRGFDGRFHALAEFRTRAVDVAFLAAVTSAALGLLVWDLLER